MSERLSDGMVAVLAAHDPDADGCHCISWKDGTSRLADLASEVQERRAIEAKLRELHAQVYTLYGRSYCARCHVPPPCPTIRLLDGDGSSSAG